MLLDRIWRRWYIEKKVGRLEISLNGSKLSSGIFFYRIVAGDYISTRKFVLVK